MAGWGDGVNSPWPIVSGVIDDPRRNVVHDWWTLALLAGLALAVRAVHDVSPLPAPVVEALEAAEKFLGERPSKPADPAQKG